MTRRRGILALATVAALALAWPAGAERQASLTARLTLSTPPVAGKAFRIAVDLTDAATGMPPRDIGLSGWIRPVRAGDPSCEDTARAFRVTRGLPYDAIDLNGILLAVLNDDASLGVVDPNLNLRSSNMVGAARFPTLPDASAQDAEGMRLLFAFAESGTIEVVSIPDGDRAPFASGLDRPAALATAGGGVWVGEDGSGRLLRLDPDGRVVARTPVGAGHVELRASEGGEPMVAAFATGDLVVLDALTGREIARETASGAASEPVADLAFLGDFGWISLPREGTGAAIRYRDAPESPVRVEVGQLAGGRIAASPDGRVAIAFRPGEPQAAIIDVAAGGVAQAVALQGPGIAEVAFTDRSAFILASGGAFAAALDLASIAPGKPAAMHRVPLGGSGDPGPGGRLLLSLDPAPQVLAVTREPATGWLLHEAAAFGEMPPSESVNLRGGVPLAVSVIDRTLRETAPGRYETVAAIPSGGPHELVLTTGIAGMTTCLPIAVEGPRRPPPEPYRLAVRPLEAAPIRAGQETELVFAFSDKDGAPIEVETAAFLVPSLGANWSRSVTARRDGGGALRARVRFPTPGLYAVQPLGIPAPWHLAENIILEVEQ